MIVYINGVRKNVLILGNENEVLDETLDSANFSFIDSNPLPLAPYQRVEIRHENNAPSTYFVTISDSVEPYTPTSSLYKHEITCAESTRILSKRMLRNSVFSQPPYPRIGKMAICGVASGDIVLHKRYTITHPDSAQSTQSYSHDGWYKDLNVPSDEKCSSAKIRITTQLFTGSINNENWQQAFVKRFTNYEQVAQWQSPLAVWDHDGKLTLYYTDTSNVEHHEELQFDETLLNGEMDCPRIKELINSGAKNIHLKTTTNCPCFLKITDGFFSDTEQDGHENHIIGFSVQFDIIAETYKYTAYSILEAIKKRIEQRHRVRKYENGSWEWQDFSRGELFSLPQSGELYTLLNNTITPNMTFTQCSVYEAVAEVFRLFDAIFTMDEDGVLGITYFNEKTGNANPQVVAKNSAIGEERYINGLMCYYQDARAEVSFPRGGAYGADKGGLYARPSSKGIGIVGDTDRVFRTPSPIHDIIGLYQKIDFLMFIVSSNLCTIHGYEINMTDFVYEQSIWNTTLDISSSLPSNPNGIKQMNTITYAKGDRYIDLSLSYNDSWGFYKMNFINATKCALLFSLGYLTVNAPENYPCVFPTTQTTPSGFLWTSPQLRIEYRTTADGVFKVESYANKYDGEMPIDQASGSIDLGKAGLNILGLSFKMGEPTLNVTHRSTSWEGRIQKGFVLNYQGEQWTANNCRYTCIGEDEYQGQISFVKNYNELSLNKKVLREKRLSSISNELTIKSEEIITEFCYVFDDVNDLDQSKIATCWDASIFAKGVANTFNATTNLQSLNDLSLFTAESGSARRLFLPSIRYGAGDLICFEMGYDEPMVAGIEFSGSTTGWFGTATYYSKYVLYTNNRGYLDDVTLEMAVNDIEGYDIHFPELNPTTPSEVAFNINQYEVGKQPNEVFALNFQTAFIPFRPNKVIIGKPFIEDNFLVKGVKTAKKLVFYASDNETYSVLDTKCKGSEVQNQAVVLSEMGAYFRLSFGGQEMTGHESWAVGDENGNIIIACNSGENSLYFALMATRL